MKKIISMILVIALTATLAVSGTLAYLQDEDSDVNVMTLGNVSIAQHEFERVVDANGNYTTINVDGVNSYELKEFTQGKPLFPFVGEVDNGYDATEVRLAQLGHNSRGGMSVFTAKNVQDKFVVVENTGKSDAYVRTIVALEAGSLSYEAWLDVINYSYHFTWSVNELDTVVEIDGNNYVILEFVYQGYEDIQHPNGVLTPGDYTYNSLAQVYMYDTATNEDCEALDGNKNGTFDILVLSQAVQTAGFEGVVTARSAESSAPAVALNTAFGEAAEANVIQWFSGMQAPVVVSTFAELKDAARNGGKFVLGADINITDKSEFFYGSYVTAIYNDMILDLNGHSITVDVDMGSVSKAPILFYVYAEGASLTVVGDGDVIAKHDAFLVFPRSVSEGAYIYGGNWYNNDETSGTKNDINAIVYSQTNSNIHIYGGTFTFKNVNGHCGAFNVYDNRGAQIVLHEGVLLSDSSYYKGSDADEIHLAEGCTLQEVVIDGVTWYQVVK